MHTKKSKVAPVKSKVAAPKKVAKKAPAKSARGLAETKASAPITWFTASWCPPCKLVKQEYEKLSAEDKALFEIVDVDAQPARTNAAGVESMPTFIRSDGAVLNGAQPTKKLIAWAKAV